MWALLFIRSSAGAHRHSRVRSGYGSYETSPPLPLRFAALLASCESVLLDCKVAISCL